MAEKSTLSYCNNLDMRTQGLYFKALLNAPAPILIVREDGRFLLINSAAREAAGFLPEEMVTTEKWSKLIQSDATDCMSNCHDIFFKPEKKMQPLRVSVSTKSGKSLIWDLFSAPLGRTEDGQRMVICIAAEVTEKIKHARYLEESDIRLEHQVDRSTDDFNPTINAHGSEISRRKRIGNALAHSRDSLRRMSRRTLTALEADRRTISKELHDSLGASLAAIKFSLEDKELKRTQNENRLYDSLDTEIACLMTTIKETKRISATLRPTILDDLGLLATIKWFLRQFQRRCRHIRIEYRVDIDDSKIPESLQILIFRLIQEALNNVEKHSRAKVVLLELKPAGEIPGLVLLIEDDGQGFDVKKALAPKDLPLTDYGLIALRERCEIFGGSLQIDSRIGEGTKIKAVLPILAWVEK